MEAVAAMSRASDGTSSVASEELLAAAEREVRTQGVRGTSLFLFVDIRKVYGVDVDLQEFNSSSTAENFVQRSSSCLRSFVSLLR